MLISDLVKLICCNEENRKLGKGVGVANIRSGQRRLGLLLVNGASQQEGKMNM